MARSDADKQEAADLLAEAEANTSGPVLTPEQTVILFALVARQGFVAQNDLGVPCTPQDRAAIEKAELAETIKREQNALWLKLTHAGWDWIADNVRKAVPPSHSVVHHLMLRIDAHLREAGEATGEGWHDFIGTHEAGPMDPELTGSAA